MQMINGAAFPFPRVCFGHVTTGGGRGPLTGDGQNFPFHFTFAQKFATRG